MLRPFGLATNALSDPQSPTDLVATIFFTAAICSGSSRRDTGDFACMCLALMDVASALDSLAVAGLFSGSRSQTSATECDQSTRLPLHQKPVPVAAPPLE